MQEVRFLVQSSSWNKNKYLKNLKYRTFILETTVDREIFMLKIIRVKNFSVDKFSQFRSILEIFLRKMFCLHVKFSRLVSTAKLF